MQCQQRGLSGGKKAVVGLLETVVWFLSFETDTDCRQLIIDDFVIKKQAVNLVKRQVSIC